MKHLPAIMLPNQFWMVITPTMSGVLLKHIFDMLLLLPVINLIHTTGFEIIKFEFH